MSTTEQNDQENVRNLECPDWVDDSDLLDRFYEKIFPLPNGCWYWDGAKSSGGWGLFPIYKQDIRGAHRVSWTIANRERIPDGYDIHHECGRRWCLAPDHLKKVLHSNHPSHHGPPANRILTRQDIQGIKMLLEHTSRTQEEIGDMHDVHPSRVSGIKNGDYDHLDVPIPHARDGLTDEEVKRLDIQLVKMLIYHTDYNDYEIAEIIEDWSRTWCWNIRTGKTHTDVQIPHT